MRLNELKFDDRQTPRITPRLARGLPARQLWHLPWSISPARLGRCARCGSPTIGPSFAASSILFTRRIGASRLVRCRKAEVFGRWFFVVLGRRGGGGGVLLFLRTPRNRRSQSWELARSLLAGIAGNLTDRARLGYVIDFIVVHAGSWRWPTFNVADASISIGALLLAYDLIFEEERRPLPACQLQARRNLTGAH